MKLNEQALTIIHPGMLTLVQDLGRYGQAHLGLTSGGPADKLAFLWANRLLGNHANAAMLELTFGGLKLRVNIDSTICVTGAKLAVSINGREQSMWATHRVKAGDEIEFGYTSQGVRAYFAIQGGLLVDKQFSSCSTVVREGLGGIDGAALKSGDTLPATQNKAQNQSCYLAAEDIPQYSNSVLLKVILGYQYQDFSRLQQQRFFSSKYQVSKQWDRMGYRLTGPAIKTEKNKMLSEGIALGAIQIPADGQPIVLMQDRQTIGGYPKIGSVFSNDLSKLAQCGQGATINFEPISIECAHNQLHLEQHRYNSTKIQLSK